MKRSLIKTAIVSLLIMITAGGCKKFLTNEIPGAFPESDFYKTDDDVTQAVTGVYDMLSNAG
jgi:starch-binding outer membrane protein, SusD/RagB family